MGSLGGVLVFITTPYTEPFQKSRKLSNYLLGIGMKHEKTLVSIS